MRALIFIVIIGFFSSCKITGQYFAGDGLNNTSITLKKDHSFIFYDFHDASGLTTISGEWSIQNKVLKLKGNRKPSFTPNSITSKYDSTIKTKLIVIQYMDVAAPNVIVAINDNELIDTTNYLRSLDLNDSLFSFPITGFYTNLDSIGKIQIIKTNGFRSCGLIQTEFKLQDSKANYIRIFAQPYNQYYGMEFIFETEWLIENRKIYNWRNENSEFNKKIYLKKWKKKTATNKSIVTSQAGH